MEHEHFDTHESEERDLFAADHEENVEASKQTKKEDEEVDLTEEDEREYLAAMSEIRVPYDEALEQ
jgi:hypothetical protein